MTKKRPCFYLRQNTEHRCFSIENKLFNKNDTHSRSFLSLTRFFLLSVGYWPYQHSSTKSPPLETPGCFVLHGRKVQKQFGFCLHFSFGCLVLRRHNHRWRMLGKDTCLLSKPVRLRLGVLPEFVYLWDKKKKNQTRRHDGMDASQIMHFLSFLV